MATQTIPILASSTGAGVLVIDDEKILRRELAESLREVGLRPFQAATGRRALAIINKEDIRAAVVDLRMPGMDGIDTARAIQSLKNNVIILFLTAFDSPEYRSRAAEAKLRVERWIDKDQAGIRVTVTAVKESLNRKVLASVSEEIARRIRHAAEQTQLDPRCTEDLLERLDLHSLLVPGEAAVLATTVMPSRDNEETTADLAHVLGVMRQYIDALWQDYPDPAKRRGVWEQMQRLVRRQLWVAAESSTQNQLVRQLAVQLEVALCRIDGLLLKPEHLAVVETTIERMLSSNLDQTDVAACKKLWRDAGVETMPSLSRVLQEQLYANEPDGEQDPSTIGDDHTDPSCGR